jgi:hypothetical protein
LDYLQQMEQYLEENQVYELFEDLLRQIVCARPESPMDFIMEKLKQQTGK